MSEKIHEDEISLKELLETLLEQWKLIVAFVVVSTLVGFIYGFFIAKPSYESVQNGMLSLPESITNQYGEYKLLSSNPSDYLSIIQSDQIINQARTELGLEGSTESIRNRITIQKDDKSSIFAIKTAGGTAAEAKALAEVLSRLFFNEIHVMVKGRAIQHFVYELQTNQKILEAQIDLTREEMEITASLLAEQEPTITLKKLVLSDPLLAAELAENEGTSIEALSGDMMLEEVPNPHYNTLKNNMIGLQRSLHGLLEKQSLNEVYLEELNLESLDMVAAQGLDAREVQADDAFATTHLYVKILDEARLPESPVAPRKMLILAISFVLGSMLGVFVAFFKAYWKRA